jgi:DNA-binding IclR family transcriptional regulator
MIVRHLTSHDPVQELMARAPIDPAVDVLMRIRSEYREMPGLCLTLGQARRLWALDEGTCNRLLSNLVSEGYLRKSSAGYVRAS